jgi:hypothetical protein
MVLDEKVCTKATEKSTSDRSSITDEWSPADDLYVLYISPGAERLPTLVKHWKSTAAPAPAP